MRLYSVCPAQAWRKIHTIRLICSKHHKINGILVCPYGIYARIGSIRNPTECSQQVRVLIQTDECINTIKMDFPWSIICLY